MKVRNIEVDKDALMNTENENVKALYKLDVRSKEVMKKKARTINWYANCMLINSIWYSQ